VDEQAVVEINAHVRNALAVRAEEDEVAHFEIVAIDALALVELAGRVGRDLEAERVREDVAHEAAAIESGAKIAPAAPVRDVAQLHREIRERAARVRCIRAGFCAVGEGGRSRSAARHRIETVRAQRERQRRDFGVEFGRIGRKQRSGRQRDACASEKRRNWKNKTGSLSLGGHTLHPLKKIRWEELPAPRRQR